MTHVPRSWSLWAERDIKEQQRRQVEGTSRGKRWKPKGLLKGPFLPLGLHFITKQNGISSIWKEVCHPTPSWFKLSFPTTYLNLWGLSTLKMVRLRTKTAATITRPWAPGRPEQEWPTNSPSLRAAFTATQTDGLKLTCSVNNSNPLAGQVLTFQCWFTINPATVF